MAANAAAHLSDDSSLGSRGPSTGAPFIFGVGFMDRYAIFVDAGYVYAEGGKLCCNTPSRDRFTLDVAGFNSMLRDLACEHSGLGALRTYWYDGARDNVRTATHLTIAALPHVKLRLGSVNVKGQQKGVDALVYRDLMTLARERAISDAFLLSGDEDLREGVRAAQDQGVRVAVIGITPSSGSGNQSCELVFEADEVITLSRQGIEPFFAANHRPRPADALAVDVPDIGSDFAVQWLQRAAEQEIHELISKRPIIPRPLDAELMRHAERALGLSLKDDDGTRRRLRGSFWETIANAGSTPRKPAAMESPD